MKPQIVKEYTEQDRADLLTLVDRALELTVDHLAMALVLDAASNGVTEMVMRNMLRSHHFSLELARDRLTILRQAVLSDMTPHHEMKKAATP